MAEFRGKDTEPVGIDSNSEQLNSLTFDEKVIRKIVGYSVNEIPGILAMSGNLISGITDVLKSTDDAAKGISVEVGKKQTAVSMKVICEYGQCIPDIFQMIVSKVTSSVSEMTGLIVVEVNVHVTDVLTKEDFDRRKKNVAKAETALETADDEDARQPVE